MQPRDPKTGRFIPREPEPHNPAVVYMPVITKPLPWWKRWFR